MMEIDQIHYFFWRKGRRIMWGKNKASSPRLYFPLCLKTTVKQEARTILRNHTYLKVYKCWRILPIIKTPTINVWQYFSKNILISKDFILFI